MNSSKQFLSLVFAILITANAFGETTPYDQLKPRRSGAILLKFKKDSNQNDLIRYLESHENELKSFSSFLNGETINRNNSADDFKPISENVFSFNYVSFSTSLKLNSNQEPTFVIKNQGSEELMAQIIKNSNLVEFAEPDYVHFPDAVMVNDPILHSQWYVDMIGLQRAWEVSVGNTSVQVLVCDTGVLSNHPDLNGNIVAEGFNFVDSTNQIEPSGNAHGTQVSGLIGAHGNNSIGIAGLNWEIQIIPGKISNDPKGATLTSTMISCVQWAAEHKIRLVNLSYNGGGSEALTDASKTLFENNGLLIFTSGNKGEELSYPHNPYAVRVGASDFYDFKAWWSNSGNCLDMVAPGVSMFSTDLNGDYKRVQGTSFAAPMVTGAAALLLSIEPKLTSAQLRNLIIHSSKDIGAKGYDVNFGHGRLDIYNAIQMLQQNKF